MACGTGKTLVALWTSESLSSERTLVLVPSLSLMSQTIREWSANTSRSFRLLPVCSDETVTDDDHFISHTNELGFPATTNPSDIAEFLIQPGPSVVFSTYQSSPMVAEAFKIGAPPFDLAIVDEAHRCAGAPSEAFRTILDEALISARRRLFMTATPRYLSVEAKKTAAEELQLTSMDDEHTFGPVFHRLTFGEAIEQGLLSDYQVAVVGVDEPMYAKFVAEGRLVTLNGHLTDARSVASQIALAKALAKFDLRRVLTFHARVRLAKRFMETFADAVANLPTDERPKGTVWTSYVSGEMPSGERDRRLRIFGDQTENARRLLANVRCLAEGVDVPTIDGLAFIDPRGSAVDIVQAVGRVLRRSAGKTRGTVVLPVFIDSATAADLTLSSSVFAPVWKVLVALRAHDETLAEQLDELRRSIGRGSVGPVRLPSRVILDLPTTIGRDFADAFSVMLVEKTTRNWEFWYGLLEEYVREHGNCNVLRRTPYRGFPLANWINGQRGIYANGIKGHDGTIRWKYRGELTPEQIARLESIRAWTWSPTADYFERGFRTLTKFVKNGGNANVYQSVVVDQFPLGRWVGWLRAAYRNGRLEQNRIERLEHIPGWVWDPYTEAWENAFSHLTRYVDRTGNADVPSKHIEEGFALGRWVSLQREFSRRPGRLSEARRARLEAVRGWKWEGSNRRVRRELPPALAERNAKAWQLAYERIVRFAQENGHARVPIKYREDDGFGLGNWVGMQRKEWKKGILSADRQKLLEAVPGWIWVAHGDAWEKAFAALVNYVKRNGNVNVPMRGEIDGIHLGRWIEGQRKFYARGTLDPSRRERLEAVPGWEWTGPRRQRNPKKSESRTASPAPTTR